MILDDKIRYLQIAFNHDVVMVANLLPRIPLSNRIMIEAGTPSAFVYVPMGPGLKIFPLGGFRAFAVAPWMPLGVTGVVRGAAGPALAEFVADPGRQRQRTGDACRLRCAAEEVGELFRTVAGRRTAVARRNDDVHELARQAVTIEKHYGCPMDMEWARDGETGNMYIVQARPETVQSHAAAGKLKSYTVHAAGGELTRGLSVGSAAAVGEVF